MRARIKHVFLSGIVLFCLLFFWIINISKQGGDYEDLIEERFAELREKLQTAELVNQQRENDIHSLHSQFNVLIQLLSQNNTNRSYLVENIPSIMHSSGGFNVSEKLDAIHLPSIFTYLPHLTGHPKSLQPLYKLSNNRYGASVVIGIPTIRRDKVNYVVETVKSLIQGLTEEEQKQCLIIVFVAEPWDQAYAEELGSQLQEHFLDSVKSGLLEVISPPAEFYPDLNSLKLTFGDSQERVRWRTKQNLDFSFLMLYARTRGVYYVQLEDDIVAKPGYFTIMKTYADKQQNSEWILLEFSTLGFIGKLFKTVQLPVVVEFFLMFHKDKPIDWLLDHLLSVKVCSPEKDAKHCLRMKSEVRKRYKPSLFQHVGMQSSLKGKVQKLKDKDFGKQAVYRAHVNPSASLKTSIKAYQKYTLQKAYTGEDIFWGISPDAGETVEFLFDPPMDIQSFLFRSGSANHPDDKFTNTTVEILSEGVSPGTASAGNQYVVVAQFSESGIARGDIDPSVGKLSSIRLHVLVPSSNWVVLSEVHIVPRKS